MQNSQSVAGDLTTDAHDLPREIYGLPSAAAPEFTGLAAAISVDDAERARELVAAQPGLLRQRLTHHSSLPLTLAAKDCSVAAFRVLLGAGADPAADHHAALFRACAAECPEIAGLLIERGADVNAVHPEYGPVLMAACECHAADCVTLLLAHGADPNLRSAGRPARTNPFLSTSLGMAIGAEVRSDRLHRIVRALIDAGAEFEDGPVMDLHRGDLETLEGRLREGPALVDARFTLPYGNTPLEATTLLHVAAEYADLPAARLLLENGADVNAPSGSDDRGPTPLFHAAASYRNHGLEMLRFLLDAGADTEVHAGLAWRGAEQSLTPLAWARVGPGAGTSAEEVALLRRRGSPETHD